MTRALDDVAFLARSENRVTVLEALSERHRSRAELEASTGVTKVSAGRVLEDFLERGWITRTGDEYRATPTGEAVAADLARLLTTVGTARKLRPVASHLPDVGFDVRRLEDATVTVPDSNAPTAPFERPVELLRGAGHARFLTRMATPAVLEVLREGVRDGRQRAEAVLADGAVERIRDHPEMAAWTRELLASGRVEAARCDGPLDVEAATFDRTVALLVTDERNAVRGLVETTDESVREWFDAAFEAHRRRADPLGSGDFTDTPDTP